MSLKLKSVQDFQTNDFHMFSNFTSKINDENAERKIDSTAKNNDVVFGCNVLKSTKYRAELRKHGKK